MFQNKKFHKTSNLWRIVEMFFKVIAAKQLPILYFAQRDKLLRFIEKSKSLHEPLIELISICYAPCRKALRKLKWF